MLYFRNVWVKDGEEVLLEMSSLHDIWLTSDEWVQLLDKYNNPTYCISGLKDKMKCLKSMLMIDDCGVTSMHLCVLVLETSLGLVVEIQWSGYDGFLK